MNQELYRHDDYRAWIRAWLEANPHRSQRWLAGKLGVSPGYLSMVVNARRDLGLHHARLLGASMGLEGDDLTYFEALVRAEHGPSLELRRAARHHVRATQSFVGLRPPAPDHYAWFGSWVHLAILGLATFEGFDPSTEWIRSRLWPEVEDQDVAAALSDLLDSGILARTEDGTWRADTSPLGTDRQIDDPLLARAAHRLHSDQLRHAELALSSFSPTERVAASVSLAIAEEKLPQLIAALNRFHLDVIEPFRTGPAERLVEVLVVAFPRSRAP